MFVFISGVLACLLTGISGYLVNFKTFLLQNSIAHFVSRGALWLRTSRRRPPPGPQTSYWQLSPGAAAGADRSESDSEKLRRLTAALAGPRGKHMDRRLLLECLGSHALRRPVLDAMTDAMVASYAEIEQGAGMEGVLGAGDWPGAGGHVTADWRLGPEHLVV